MNSLLIFTGSVAFIACGFILGQTYERAMLQRQQKMTEQMMDAVTETFAHMKTAAAALKEIIIKLNPK